MVRTLCAAMGRPANAHEYALTDTSTGRVKGIYATQEFAIAAVQHLVGKPGLWVLTVVHPARCQCAEAA